MTMGLRKSSIFKRSARQFRTTAGFAGGDLAEFLDVGAGDEGLAAADDHAALTVVVSVELLERGSDAFRHSRAQRVHWRIVDGDDGNAVVFRELNQVAHR